MSNEVLKQIDEQINYLHRCRAVFPYLGPQLAGTRKFKTAPYYGQHGLNVEIELSTPATLEFIDDFNNLAHWINENFVLRLFAVLDSNRLYKDLSSSKQVDGYKDMEILRRLRNKIGHGSGKYDPADPEKKRLHNSIMRRFNVDSDANSKTSEKYPIPIEKVLISLAEGCKRFAIAITAA